MKINQIKFFPVVYIILMLVVLAFVSCRQDQKKVSEGNPSETEDGGLENPRLQYESTASADSPAEPARSIEYKTVILGNQSYRSLRIKGKRWMVDNLNYELEESWCYDLDPANCLTYGRLYTWEAARKACAAVGWRLPTDQEWREMTQLFGGPDYDGKTVYQALRKGGSSSFEAQMGGFRFNYGAFEYLGSHGYYWTSTEDGKEYAWAYDLYSGYETLYRIHLYKTYGYSCRCISDE